MNRVRKPLAIVIVVCVAAGVGLTGCSSLPLVSGSGGDTGLGQALTRVAANSTTRSWVSYDATGKLTKLVGKQLTRSGFGALLLEGTNLGPVEVAQNLADDTGIAPLDAEYGISAGLPPRPVSVLVGGQHAGRVGSALTNFGWTNNGQRYVAPALNTLTHDSRAAYAMYLAQVRTDGGDVIFGFPETDLGAAGHPAGKTLADDQPTRALADCLGNVVVAQMDTRYQSPAMSDRLPGAYRAAVAKQRPAGIQLDKLAEVAVGVRSPNSASDTPRAVVCIAWSDQSAADGYATALPGILAGKVRWPTDESYARLLHNPETKNVGGSAHVVEWSADEADGAAQIITMLQKEDLPGLF